MSSTARLHHYVPQCYLKGFARNRSKKSKLFIMDGKLRRAFESTPRNVAAERDFNRIDTDGVAPDALENEFAQFEGKLDKALERVILRRSFHDHEDRVMVINLVALLAIRNPRLRENMRLAQERTTRVIMDLALSSPEQWEHHVQEMRAAGHATAGLDVTYEEMKAFWEGERYRHEIDRTRHIVRELNTAAEMLPLLFRRKWSLLKAGPARAG